MKTKPKKRKASVLQDILGKGQAVIDRVRGETRTPLDRMMEIMQHVIFYHPSVEFHVAVSRDMRFTDGLTMTIEPLLPGDQKHDWQRLTYWPPKATFESDASVKMLRGIVEKDVDRIGNKVVIMRTQRAKRLRRGKK